MLTTKFYFRWSSIRAMRINYLILFILYLVLFVITTLFAKRKRKYIKLKRKKGVSREEHNPHVKLTPIERKHIITIHDRYYNLRHYYIS